MVVSTFTCALSGFDSDTYARRIALVPVEVAGALRHCELLNAQFIESRLDESSEECRNTDDTEVAILPNIQTGRNESWLEDRRRDRKDDLLLYRLLYHHARYIGNRIAVRTSSC